MSRPSAAAAAAAIATFVLLASPPARADTSAAAPAGLALRGVDVHVAGRLIATAFRINLVVAADVPPVEATLPGATVSDALAQLASKTGLAVYRRGNLWALASKEAIGRMPIRPLLGGNAPPISFDLLRADAREVFRVIGEVYKHRVASEVTGEVTIITRNVPVLDVAELLAELARAQVTLSQRGIDIGPGQLGVPKLPAARPCPPPERAFNPLDPAAPAHKLGCVSRERLELAGFAGPPGHTIALVRGRSGEGDGAGEPHTDLVRVGDRVSVEGAIVRGVVPGAPGALRLELADGKEVLLRAR